ncbi:hypothetical protein FRC08_004054 [Ceratobasidium sp. 394]|nr:hypothetical protein FRC08_004054 [Ceratobasidium sp. 394]
MAQTKRPRTVQTKNTATFHSAEQLTEALRTRNPEALKNALVSFRNQITVVYDERPGVGDARLALVTAWLDKSPGTSELFDVWDTGSNFTSLVLVSLGHVLSLLAGTPGTIVHASAILRVLFDSTHARRLNAHLASGQTDVVLAALKVLNAAALIDQRATFEAVAWTAKALPKLLSHRHRTPTSQPLAHPSIRTALTTLLLALLPLSLSLDIFPTLFRGLAQDDGVVVKLILEASWEKVWCDAKVSKSLKVKVFGGLGMFIQPLYSRTDPDSTEPLAPADIAHHFLLALCTNPGSGLCFRSKGWYPRPSGNPFEESVLQRGEDEGEKESKSGTLYNPLLLKLLRLLRPAADARQFELAVRILSACPDLVGAYFAKGAAQIGLSLEPRLSTRWITSVGFMNAVIGADVPVESFHLEALAHSASTRVYRAEPPPLNAIVENVIPGVLTRTWLTKALLTKSAPSNPDTTTQPSSGGLVQHTTIRLLTRCLLKLSAVLESFPPGWAARAVQVVDAVKRRMPEVGVVVGVAQEAVKALVEGGEGEGTEAKRVLLAEGALRLLLLYARVLPGAMAEVRFDVGKLLQETEVEGRENGGNNGMRVMCQIHVLRLLGESDQFVWSAKPAGSTHTHMYRLLSLHLRTPYPQLRDASVTLIVRLLSSSVLFEHDPREAKAWVDALPRNLEDVSVFLEFFDDVLLRCAKTPYRYLEAGNQLYGRLATNLNVSRMPSPLLMAVLEQLKNKPMDPPARRMVAVFMARLLRALVGKMEVESAKAVAAYMRYFFETESGQSGGLRVVGNLDAFFGNLELEGSEQMDLDEVSAAEARLTVDEMEATDIGGDEVAKGQAALGILQWLRTFQGQVGAAEVARLAKLLVSWPTDGVVLAELLEELDMRVHSGAVLGSDEDALSAVISFPLAFWVFLRHGSDSVPASELFAKSLLRQPVQQLLWACGLISHSLGAAVRASSKSAISNCLVALELVAQRASGTFEVMEIKQALFGELEVVKGLMFEAGWASHIASIISSVLSSEDEEDCALAAPYPHYWSKRLLESEGEQDFEKCAAGFTIWVPFTPGQICAQVFKSSLELIENWASVSPTIGSLLEQLAMRLRSSALDKDSATQLAETLPQLIKVPPLPEYRNLLKLAPTIAERELPLGLDLGSFQPCDSLTHVTEQARIRWTSRTGALSSISWQGFSGWLETPELVRLSTALMYLSANARAAFSSWIGQQSSLPARAIGACFALTDCHAALTRTSSDQTPVLQTTVDIIVDCAARILFKHGERSEHQRWAAQTLTNVVHALPGEVTRIVRSTVKRFPSNPRDTVQHHVFFFVSWAASHSSHWDELVDSVVDSTLLWLVRRFAEDESDSSELLGTLSGFESLLPHVSNMKAHLAEPVLIAAIKNRLDVPVVMELCSKLVRHTALKPASVNKLLQSIIHHSSFTSVCRTPSPTRDEVIGLLHSLFHKHPSSTCHPSHIIPLLGVYQGTLDLPDTQILSIFQLFEKSRQMSTLAILRNWTPEMSQARPKDLLSVVCNFDPVLMFRTCTSFPQRRDPGTMELSKVERKGDIYDPNFVLPLLAALMVSDEPITSMQWVSLCRTNVLSLALSSLSSKRPAMRQLGYASLTTAYIRLLDVDFQERAQLMYTLDLFRDLLPSASATPSDPIPRLPTYTTLLLSHAIRDIFAPATPLYPLISRFLLQRPEFDPRDVPMLYTLLYSSSGEWKRERGWVLRFLADGMRSTEDWKVLKRRHTWDLLASLFQSVTEDRTLRLSVLEVLINASANKHAATSLLLNSSILSWVYMQLGPVLMGEPLAYLKIIENIAIVVDHDQIEKATAGHWRDTVAQIIHKIIQTHGSDSGLVCLASRILLRLTTVLGTAPQSFVEPMRTIVQFLRSYEPSLAPHSCGPDGLAALDSDHLHTNRDLLHPMRGATSIHWSSSVRALWRVVVIMERVHPDIWEVLNSRMLLLAGMDACGIQETEWTRHQLVEILVAP